MQSSKAELERVFPGDSEMAQRMRAYDWSTSPIGAINYWPQSLKTAIGIMLNSRYPMFVWWGHARTNFYNDAYIPVLGKRHPMVLGMPAQQVWHEIWNQLGPQSEQVLLENKAVWCDQVLLVMSRNGFTEETYFTYSYSRIPDDDGNTGGVLCVCSEDTQRVLSQRRLQALRALGEAVTAQTAPAACEYAAATLAEHRHDLPFALFYLLDGEGEEAQLVAASGITTESRAAPARISLADNTSWPLHKVAASGRAVEVERLSTKFGTLPGGPWPETPQRAVVLPLARPGQTRLAGFIIAGVSPRLVFDDEYRNFLNLVAGHVTTAVANAEAHEAERQRIAALAELDRAKTTFFSNISHEFRTPLTLLLGPANDLLATQRDSFSEDALEQVGTIQRNARRLQKLVNNLLDFSRIEAGRMQAQYMPTDLASLSSELASVFRSAIEHAGMRLVVDCAPLAQPVFVDRGMWEKIVLNLISNAFKYSLQGEIGVSLRQAGDTVVFAVRDTGIGIAAAELPKLFSRFYRIQGARGRSEEGTGIGLAMVRELVKLHGGTVSIVSEPGLGSTFSVAMPLGHAHLPVEQVLAEETPLTLSGADAFIEEARQWVDSPPEQSDDHTLEQAMSQVAAAGAPVATVLVADDNADMRSYLQRLLHKHCHVHCHVLLASNGREALQLALEHEPDLVLTDVMMPELDGFALLQALRHNPATSTMAVILLSARAGEEARIEGLLAGADDYLTKPFNVRELVARVSSMVKLARARREAYVLEQRLRQEAEELNRLHSLSNRLLTTPSLKAALEEVLGTAMAVTGAGMGNIQLYDAESGTLQLFVQHGLRQEFIDYFAIIGAETESACSKALLSGQRVLVENVQTDPAFAPHRAIMAQAGVLSIQSTPLINRDGRIVGILSTHFNQPQQFEARTLSLLDIYSHQAVGLIERLSVEEALRHSETRLTRELEAMNRLHVLSNRLLAAPILQDALNEVLEASMTLLGAPMGSVQLYDIQRGRLQLLAHRGFTPAFLEFYSDLDVKLGTPCGRAVQRGQRVVTENIGTDPLYAHLDMREAGFSGVQCTPLINRAGEVLGIISSYFRQPYLPAKHELRMLDLYAYQAVNLIERLHAEEALRASEARFRALADASPALIWQLDAEGNVIYINETRYRSLLGLTSQNMLGKNWLQAFGETNAEEAIAALMESQLARTPIHRCFDLKDSNGQSVVLETHALPWYGPDGHYAGHVGISVDITASMHTQRELSISNERLKLAIEGAGDGVWDWDMQSGKIMRSRRFLEILGQEEQQEVTTYEAWGDLVHPDDMAKVMAALDVCIHNSPAPYICEYRMRCSSGDWKWLLSRGIVVARDAGGTALRMTGTISDISEKRRMDETIWQHANFDTLTSLPNRRLFRDRLNQEILKSQRTGLPMALFFIDLDQFKEVNDLLGHDVGDMLLTEASKRICTCVRQSDTVARLGGDEFTTIVSELEDEANVEAVAQKIIAALSEPFHLGDEVIYLSASLGVTMYPADADNAERLIRNADQAMYAAKNAGRNQFSYFTRSMQEEALARLRLIGDLRHALEYGQLQVYYQPVIDLSTGHIVKAEALLRWDHPHFGLLQPPAFISLAEESGLIHEIGNWIFMEAALSSRQWTEQLGELFQISVNKSPVQLVSQNKGVNWAQHLETLGMEGSSITIEITEGLLLNASANVHNKLLCYRDAGLEIAIDDFGTGYSSMAYLKKFDVDYLKIDRSFIRDMTHDAGNLTIVKSIIVMAHELGLKVIAEGIETEEQRQLLVEAGCDFGQGFLYAEPLPAEQFETLLLSNYVYRRQPYQLSAPVHKLIS